MLFTDIDKKFEDYGYEKRIEDLSAAPICVYYNPMDRSSIRIVISERLKSYVNIIPGNHDHISMDVKLNELILKKYLQMKVNLNLMKKEKS